MIIKAKSDRLLGYVDTNTQMFYFVKEDTTLHNFNIIVRHVNVIVPIFTGIETQEEAEKTLQELINAMINNQAFFEVI